MVWPLFVQYCHQNEGGGTQLPRKDGWAYSPCGCSIRPYHPAKKSARLFHRRKKTAGLTGAETAFRLVVNPDCRNRRGGVKRFLCLGVPWRSKEVAILYPIFYTDAMEMAILKTDIFNNWFRSLADKRAVMRIQTRIDRAEDGNFGDCQPVGEGVSEMRIHYGPGYRVYFTRRGLEVVILLAGGDKSSQSRDIQKAIEMARQL